MSIDDDVLQAASGRNARAAMDAVGDAWAVSRDELINAALQAIREGKLTPDAAFLYWMQIHSLESVFRRLTKEITRGDQASARLVQHS